MDRMRTLAVALAAVALLGCGEDTGPRVVDPLMQPFVEEFTTEAAARGLPGLVVTSSIFVGDVPFGAPDSDPSGVCRIDGDARYIVVTDLYITENAETGEPEIVTGFLDFYRVLVFHELGHCVLGLPDNDVVTDGVPEIMHRSAAGFSFVIMMNWEHQLDILFD